MTLSDKIFLLQIKMNSAIHLVSPCSAQTCELSKNEPTILPIFQVENITVIRSGLLKVFNWETFHIDNLNRTLLTEAEHMEHHFILPTRQLYSTPLKIVFWLRNLNNSEYSMILKRVKNCECEPLETRVGFNQFRKLYHCPHRRLIHISQEIYVMRPGELLAMSTVAYYYMLGTYDLIYELRISDRRIIVLHFHLNITGFDPVKSVLKTDLIPVNIMEHRSMCQPLWIRNISSKTVQFSFSCKCRGFRIINPNLIIPPQSIWPLIVEYKPSDFENNLQLYVRYGDKSKCLPDNRFKIPLTCKGVIQEEVENYSVPLFEYETAEFLYVIYPNRLDFVMEINERRTQMVAIHNYSQKCMKFRWQNYTIDEYFFVKYEPSQFSLKPHHSKLCVVEVQSCNNPLHFKRIPAILDVHRILEKSTLIAKELLTEIESIDDPKWAESSYAQHVLLQLDIKVKLPQLERINVTEDCNASVEGNYTTLFEKLFWEYLSKSNYMRNTSKVPRNLTYKQVLNQETNPQKKDESCIKMSKQEAFNIISFLTAEACRDLAKNYRFIPQEMDAN